MDLNDLFRQVIVLSIMGSIFAIAILLIKAIFRKNLSGKVHYYIWFLLVLKLIIPLNFQSQLSPLNFINDKSQKYNISSVVNQNISSITNLNTNNKIQKSVVQKDIYKQPMTVKSTLKFNLKTAAIIWIIGDLSILAYIIFTNIMLWININRRPNCKRQDVDDILQESKLKLRINSKISVIYDKDIKSPFAYGIIRPKILISEHIVDKLTSQELKFVFLHELTHIKRKDLIVNVIIILLQVIYWFNPIIVYSLYQFKQDCELACDSAILAVLNSNEIRDYGETIINMIKILSNPNLFVGTLGFSNKNIKRRIIMISSFNKKSITGTVIALCLVFMVGCSSASKNLSSSLNNITANQNTTSSNTSTNNATSSTSTNTSSSNGTTKNFVTNSSKSLQNSNSQNALLQNIKNSASQGKIINCDFAVYGTPIESVESKFGKADREDFVAQAKGTYYTYSKQNVVFGVGKANYIFEARSFDRRLGQISFSMVKKFFGNPAYNVTVNGEKIIGYTAWAIDTTRQKYKVEIEFVFTKPANGNNDPMLKHYSVLFPRGTANDMGNDPGRQW
jgi:beta-lactamase regulating signal transducer with metallopeptidase domain